MTQEEKELLLKDLCARLPYRVIGLYIWKCKEPYNRELTGNLYDELYSSWNSTEDSQFLPYLRPMSSITEEEKEELLNLLFDKESKYFYIDEEGLIDGKTSYLMKEGLNYPAFCPINIVLYTDWLNAHYFDYRGLIEKGLALEASDGIYNIKEK